MLIVLGAGAIVAGVAMWSPPAAAIVAGLLVGAMGLALGVGRKKP